MATHYIENGSGDSQYYFDSASQPQRPVQDRNYPAPGMAAAAAPPEFGAYPTAVAGVRVQPQQVRSDRPMGNDEGAYQMPQQHQSVAGFNRSAPQQQPQQYQPAVSPAPQVRATVRTASSQEQQYNQPAQYQQQPSPQQRQPQAHVQYEHQGTSQPTQISPQQQHNARSQPGPPASPASYQPVPNPAQYSQHDLDQHMDSPSRPRETHVQVFESSHLNVENWNDSRMPIEDTC